MTLGGMAAAVGLIIDDAIVMVEHIVRRLRGGGGDHHGRVLPAAPEFTRPLAGLVRVHDHHLRRRSRSCPASPGAFFKALSLTMAASLIISFLVAWLAVPLLAGSLSATRRTPTRRKAAACTRPRAPAPTAACMRRLLARPRAGPARASCPLLVAGLAAATNAGRHRLHADHGRRRLRPRLSHRPRHLADRDRPAAAAGRGHPAKRRPRCATYSRRTGLQLGGGLNEANKGDFFVRLKPCPAGPSTR